MLTDTRPPPLHLVLEVARLAALRSYRVLGPETIRGLDGLVQAAAAAMGRRMAALSFVDSELLWFGPAFGIEPGERPRQGSFCDRAIAQAGPLVVRDALTDPRFRNHPDVVGKPQVRFYAGVSLQDEDGYRIGTLCVLDPEPGSAHPAGLSELARLSRVAIGMLGDYRDSLNGAGATASPLQPERIQGWLGLRTRGSGSGRGRAGSKPGLIVLSVAAESPADRAGLRSTDVLMAIDGAVLHYPADVVRALANRPVGGFARLHVLRNGQALERVVPIEPEPGPQHVLRDVSADAGRGWDSPSR